MQTLMARAICKFRYEDYRLPKRGFNPKQYEQGTPLQRYRGSLHDKLPSNPAEEEILDKYKYQLTLYSQALEAIEEAKPAPQRRIILPPGILIAASGRTVEMSADEFKLAKEELTNQLAWIGELAASPKSMEQPDRMTMEHALVCWNTGIEPLS
ncbi:MAG: hypothetical protein CM15mP8_0240 [Methanobacteriota archaeon]|nr:MAG: hypothetical protein CM15mP8_0240 [Euryarchaeota archaeon]